MTDIDVARGTIVFFSDIGCPWASLTVHRLRRRRSELGLDDGVRIDHRCFPLELFNERLTPRTTVEAEVAVIGAYEPALRWTAWRRADFTYPSTLLLPLEAVQAAKSAAVGGLRASEDLDAALRHAWYAESRSIHLYAELIDVARACDSVDVSALDASIRSGRGRAAVFEQWAQATANGVQGSPHLFLADGHDVHNPGITLELTDGKLPRITADDPSVYDDILHSAAESGRR